MAGRTWTIVKFIDEDTVEAVPTTWLLGNACYWPPYPRDKLMAAIKNFEAPNTHWPSHKMEVFRNGTFDTYLEARRKLNVAEYMSDLKEDEPQGRRNRHKKQYSSSSDDEVVTSQKEKASHKPPTRSMNESVEDSALSTNNNYLEASHIRHKKPICSSSDDNDVITAQKEKAFPKPPTRYIDEDSALSINRNATGDSCCCCPIHKEIIKTDDEIKRIKKQYVFITNILADMKTDLTDIKSSISATARPQAGESFFSKFTFPVNDENSLQEVENYLRSEENFQNTVPEIANLGGNNTYEFVKRAMMVLITNKVAVKYSFLGRKQKSSFSVLKMSNLIIKAAQHANNGNQKEVEEAISKWLRRANERKGS